MWDVIKYVSSGITLAAFIGAAVVEILRRRLRHTERLINSAREEERAKLVQTALDSFDLDTPHLDKEQRYRLAMKELRDRSQRFKIKAQVTVILAVLSVAVAVYAIHKTNPIIGPDEARYSLDFDNQTLVWAVDYLDKHAKDVSVQLDEKIISGVVKTKPFSMHLDNASLEEVLKVFCSSATVGTPLLWRRDGKSVFIEPKG